MDYFDPFQRCALRDDPDDVRELSEVDTRGIPIDPTQPVIDLSTLTAATLPEYIQSLKWKNIHFALLQIQDLYMQVGYEVSIRNSRPTIGRLECHHAGACGSRIDNEEKKHNATSGKHYCPFVVNVSMPVKSNEAKLTPTQHFTHTCMQRQVFIHGGIVRVRQLTQPMLDKIAEMVSGGKTLSTIRRDVVSKFHIYFIAPHVIQTAVNRVNAQQGKRSQIVALLNALKADPKKYVYRCSWIATKRDGVDVHEIGNVFFVTFQMISLAKHFGQFIVVDATYKSNEFGRPLLLFTIRVGTGAFTIAAVSLIQTESKANLMWSFQQLQEILNDSWNDIAVVMTDGDSSYPSIIQELLPKAKHQRCYWHQQRNMHTFCSIASDSVKCWSLMQEAMRSFHESSAEQKWGEMMEEFFSRSTLQHLLPASSDPDDPNWEKQLPDNHRNALSLLKEWYSIRHTFWQSMTKGMLNFGSIATQSGESMNNVVKQRSFVRLPDLLQMTENVSHIHGVVQVDASWTAQMRMPVGTRFDEWHKRMRKELTAWAVDTLTDQLELAIDKAYFVAQDSARPYIFRVHSPKGNRCDVDVSALTCDCGFMASRGLLCRHFFRTRRGHDLPEKLATMTSAQAEKLARMSIANAHPRWKHSTVESAFELDSLRPTIENAVHERVAKHNRVHLPDSFNMMQITIREDLQQISSFAKKSTMNARFTLSKLHQLLPELLNADEATMQAAMAASQTLDEDAVSQSTSQSSASAIPPATPLIDPLKVGRGRVRSTTSRKSNAKRVKTG